MPAAVATLRKPRRRLPTSFVFVAEISDPISFETALAGPLKECLLVLPPRHRISRRNSAESRQPRSDYREGEGEKDMVLKVRAWERKFIPLPPKGLFATR